MTTDASGLRHTVDGTVTLIPGLVLPYDEPPWEDSAVLMPTFGVKGLTVLYGARNARLLAFPMDVWKVSDADPPLPLWVNQSVREGFLKEIVAQQGKVGLLEVVDPVGVVIRTYARAMFRGLHVARRRHDTVHGHNAFCQAVFLEIAT